MTRRVSTSKEAAVGRLAARRRELLLAAREDGGQALVMALIVVLMLGLLPVITLVTLQAVQPAVSSAEEYDAALAAAQAGLQEYRTLLDEYSDYSDWSGANEPPASEGGCNPAFTGASGGCTTTWVPVNSNTPVPEYFEYTPNFSQLSVPTADGPPYIGQILLTVTGRAGNGTQWAYRRIEASLELSGAIQDLYYSDFEQPADGDYDQWQNVYNSSNTLLTSGADEWDEATVTVQPSNATDPNYGQPYAQALCQYDAWQPNTFVDWYSQNVSPIYPPSASYPGFGSGTAYSSTNPYYGPWYGTWPDPNGTGLRFGYSVGSNGACLTNYWISGDSFSGPVYSQDELTTCGTPSFTQLATLAPANLSLPAGWPGAKANGAVDNPYGYVDDPFSICGTPGSAGDKPTISSGSVTFGLNQSLPPIASQIPQEIENNQLLGCVYTGPTAIRFYWNSSTQTEQMAVWSPLTEDPYASTYNGQTAQCGATASSGPGDLCGGSSCTYNGGGQPTNTQVSATTNTVQTAAADLAIVNVVPGEVIWVQNTPTSSSDPNYWGTLPTAEAGAPYAGCIDPWVQPNSTISPNTCSEGDLMLSGATHGGIMLGADDNVVFARSLVYSCAVNNATGAFSSSLANCSSSSDVTGVIASTGDVWEADPCNASGCTPQLGYNGTTWSSGTAPTQCTDDNDMALTSVVWSDLIPDTCYLQNPIIDAAVASLNGFFEVQNWRFAAPHGNLYLNGSQEVMNAGQYGVFSSPTSLVDGYFTNLSYDNRLLYQPPPGFIQAIGAVWEVTSWMSCGESPPAGQSVGNCIPLPS